MSDGMRERRQIGNQPNAAIGNGSARMNGVDGAQRPRRGDRPPHVDVDVDGDWREVVGRLVVAFDAVRGDDPDERQRTILAEIGNIALDHPGTDVRVAGHPHTSVVVANGAVEAVRSNPLVADLARDLLADGDSLHVVID